MTLAPTDALLIGPHSVFEYGGLVLNDRTQAECYWVDETIGFDSADLKITSYDDVQEDGEIPDFGAWGSRTMILNGYVKASSYTRLLEMGYALLNAVKKLSEEPLVIRALDSTSGYLVQDSVFIPCRMGDKPTVDMKLQAEDPYGPKRRRFSVTLKATKPAFLAQDESEVEIVPEITSFLGRVYDRTYDLEYATPIDSEGNPSSGTNTVFALNKGNYKANTIVTFYGPMSPATLANNTNGQQVKLKHALLEGQSISFDVATGLVVDENGDARASFIDSRSDYLVLEGDGDGVNNELQLSLEDFDTDLGAKVVIAWRSTTV